MAQQMTPKMNYRKSLLSVGSDNDSANIDTPNKSKWKLNMQKGQQSPMRMNNKLHPMYRAMHNRRASAGGSAAGLDKDAKHATRMMSTEGADAKH